MAVNLYEVTVGPNLWRYTSGEFDVQTATELWVAVPMKRQDLTFDLKKTDLTLTVPTDLEPFNSFLYNVPILPIDVTVYEYPAMSIRFVGTITGVKYTAQTGIAEVKLGSTDTIGNTMCPNRTYGSQCSFDLFDSMCALDKNSFSITLNVEELVWLNDATFTHSVIANYPSGSFSSGYVVINTGESQFVTAHNGDQINLLGPLYTLDKSTQIEITYGCNKSLEHCDSKFSNMPNFGGFPYIPSKNPNTEGY